MGRTGWSTHAAPNGKAYWHSERTGESVWVEPVEVVRYRLATEVDGWGVHPAPIGKPYWHNEETGASVWREPPAMAKRRKAYMSSVQSASFARTDTPAVAEGKRSEASSTSSSSTKKEKKKKTKKKDTKGTKDTKDTKDTKERNATTRDEGKSADAMADYTLSDTSSDSDDGDILGELHREMDSTLQGYLTKPAKAAAPTTSSESKSGGGRDGKDVMGKQIDGWEQSALMSKDPSEMQRVLRETIAALKNSLSDVHDITMDRDALVEAIHKMSAENHEEVESLEAEIQAANAKIKRLKTKLKQGGNNGNDDRDGGMANVAALQDGLEAALTKLQSETERSRALEGSLAQLKEDNEAMRAQLAEARGGAVRGGRAEGKSTEGSLSCKEEGEPDAGAQPGRVSGKKKKKKKKKKRSIPSKNAKSPKRNTDAGAGSLVDDHIEMGRSASVVQSHMRGFIARREMRQRIETKLEEDIDIPDFGFLDALEPMSPMLQQRGVGSDRKSLRK